jgi:hypothetical protein
MVVEFTHDSKSKLKDPDITLALLCKLDDSAEGLFYLAKEWAQEE